jgi:hypothetical protein
VVTLPPPHSWSWRVFLTCWLVYSIFWTPYIVREHFPALTLAERGTLDVEAYLGWIEDIFAGPRGGAYINNNPGASIVGAIPLVLFRPLLTRVDAWNQTLPRPTQVTDDALFWRMLREGRGFYFLLVAFLTVAFAMAPATAGTAAYLCSRLMDAGIPGAHAAAAAVMYGIGTPVLFRSGLLNHNMLAGDAGFAALLLLWDPHCRRLSNARAAAAGLLAGYTVLCDYSGVVIVGVAALYVWLRSGDQGGNGRFQTLAAFAAGVAPGLAGLAMYQEWAFGSLYRPSQRFMTPTAYTSHGYLGFDWPSPRLAWANFVDPRFGLFAYCPALILALAAPFRMHARYTIPRREMWILLTYFAMFVVFCSANQYAWLQPATGFRYLVPVVPALALLAMQTAQTLKPVLRWAIAAVSGAQSLILAAAHANDIRLAVTAIWHRRFALFWMIRLGEAGAPVTWVWTLLTFLLLTLGVALIWAAPFRNRGKLTPA